MRTGLLSISIISVVLTGACNNTPKKQESTEIAKEQNEQKTNDSHMQKDAEFLVKVADGNMLEVELGKLAEKNGKMQDVKDFGKMMAEHHTKILNELKSLATIKNISVPADMSDDNRKKAEQFSNKAGRNFDDAYIDDMLDDHEKDVKEFEEKSNDEKCDADIKSWTTETLPLLKSHLTEIKRIDEKFKAAKK